MARTDTWDVEQLRKRKTALMLQYHPDKTKAPSDHGMVGKIKKCFQVLLPSAEQVTKKKSHEEQMIQKKTAWVQKFLCEPQCHQCRTVALGSFGCGGCLLADTRKKWSRMDELLKGCGTRSWRARGARQPTRGSRRRWRRRCSRQGREENFHVLEPIELAPMQQTNGRSLGPRQ